MKSPLEKIYYEFSKRLQALNDALTEALEDFVDEFDTEDRLVVEDIDKISEYLSLMDRFFDKHTAPFLGYMAVKLQEVLEIARKRFEIEGAKIEDVEQLLEVFGIEDGRVKKRKDGKITLLYAIGSLKVLENDIILLINNSFNGQVARTDLKKAVVNTANRKFRDFFEMYAVGSIFQTFNAAQKIYALKYGYKKFLYEGGIIETSRDFCIERAGLEFWYEQGLEWNEMDWKGKIQGVDFFIQCGGYNCLHNIKWLKE